MPSHLGEYEHGNGGLGYEAYEHSYTAAFSEFEHLGQIPSDFALTGVAPAGRFALPTGGGPSPGPPSFKSAIPGLGL